jgi:hypothetical protein
VVRVDPQRGRVVGPAGDLRHLLASGALRQVSAYVPDPGNHGEALVLAEDPTGSLGAVRVLIAVNGTANSDGTHNVHAVVVPRHLTDPIAAAAWSYNDPSHPLQTTAADYAAMAARR